MRRNSLAPERISWSFFIDPDNARSALKIASNDGGLVSVDKSTGVTGLV